MSDKDFLVVPMEIKALVVNDTSRLLNYQRWSMNFANLKSYTTPVPPAFSGNANFFSQDPGNNGVYLHWTLPERIRQGNTALGTTTFPLVPNRWLVVRYYGAGTARKAAAWVVESDFLGSQGTDSTCITPYLDPFAATPQATCIGRKVSLDAWKEPGTKKMFLTAIGPGELTFNAYQPYTENVFSVHDKLEDVAATDTLSYFVAGWYSDPASDILKSWNGKDVFSDWLQEELNWKVTALQGVCSQSVYEGVVQGIQWNKTGAAPPRSIDKGTVTLAVGNTSIDALTALITQQAAAQKQSGVDSTLLEAFQYNLLPRLEEPNGQAQLQEAIHKAWFGAANGGYRWIIVQRPQSGDTQKYPTQPVQWEDAALQPAWLAKLNQDQEAYNVAYNKLQVLQWRLYTLWWSRGKFNALSTQSRKSITDFDPSFTDSRFAAELDPAGKGSLASQVQDQQKLVSGLESALPGGQSQEELAASILKYAEINNLGDNYELKRVEKESFYEANNPVVLITGAKVGSLLTSDEPLVCRTGDNLVTGFTYQGKNITASVLKGRIPALNVKALPEIAADLLTEAFFLDPANAALAAAAIGTDNITAVQQALADPGTKTGTVPAIDLSPWQQPWQPLFLLWDVSYFPIAYNPADPGNWSFDGLQYSWGGKGAAGTSLGVIGRVLLTPQCSFNFKKRLIAFRDNHPTLFHDTLAKLEDFITATDDWDFLSQTLDGFMQQLALRNTDMNVVPTDTALTTLIGNNDSIVPDLGGTPVRFQGWPASNFQALRSGQFMFNRLTIVDRFGQSIEVVRQNTATQFQPVAAPDLLPTVPISKEQPYRFVQLAPRALQAGRLAFDFVSAAEDTKLIDQNTGLNPVCAWLLPNHLDDSLACYTPAGVPIGEIRTISAINGTKTVMWLMTPGSTYTTIDAVKKDFIHLGQLLESLVQKGPAAFEAFRLMIDSTLWLVDPLGNRVDQNLSVLIGRPLALLRARLQFQIEGVPNWDPSWQYVFAQQKSPFTGYSFPIRLGDPVAREDGLIGYFLGNDYGTFNAAYLPPGITDPFLKKIAPGNFINLTFDENDCAFISMLCDPRAMVHAVSRILPAITLQLPSRFVNPALDNMAVTFQTGPVLCETQTTVSETGEETTALLMPLPVVKTGNWSWLTRAAGSAYPVAKSDGDAHFSGTPPHLCTGYLKLTDVVGKEQ